MLMRRHACYYYCRGLDTNAITFCFVVISVISQCVNAFQCGSAPHRPTAVSIPSFPRHDSAVAKGRTAAAASPRGITHHHGSTLLFLANNNKKEDGNDINDFRNGIVELWNEIIEVSTYGPSERKMLKARRERQKELDNSDFGVGGSSSDNQKNAQGVDGMESMNDDDGAWMDAFASAKDDTVNREQLDFDGYAMRDLLLSKWNVPLDVDFQRTGQQIYCTVLPQVGYGGDPLACRFDTELEYLMHLQGVVEVLHKYDQLEGFVIFVEETRKVPKRGTDSVPFRLRLSREDVDRIIPK